MKRFFKWIYEGYKWKMFKWIWGLDKKQTETLKERIERYGNRVERNNDGEITMEVSNFLF